MPYIFKHQWFEWLFIEWLQKKINLMLGYKRNSYGRSCFKNCSCVTNGYFKAEQQCLSELYHWTALHIGPEETRRSRLIATSNVSVLKSVLKCDTSIKHSLIPPLGRPKCSTWRTWSTAFLKNLEMTRKCRKVYLIQQELYHTKLLPSHFKHHGLMIHVTV